MNRQVSCGICSAVSYAFTLRNQEQGTVPGAGLPERFPGALGSAGLSRGGWARGLRRSLRRVFGLFSLANSSELESRGHTRGWADGALGNRGRLEGGQYRAGRRAPPFSLL